MFSRHRTVIARHRPGTILKLHGSCIAGHSLPKVG
jgi:hypothetical protein